MVDAGSTKNGNGSSDLTEMAALRSKFAPHLDRKTVRRAGPAEDGPNASFQKTEFFNGIDRKRTLAAPM
jgi:hypothetical protein